LSRGTNYVLRVEGDSMIEEHIQDGDLIIVEQRESAQNGETVVALIDVLRRHGVQRVTLACTHGIFSGPAIERLAAIPEIDEIVTTNTVPIPPEKRLPNMTVLSVAPIFGEAIRRNILGQSVGQLFAFWPDTDECPPVD
jgi:ribose-phosphate pyrophosphokinase